MDNEDVKEIINTIHFKKKVMSRMKVKIELGEGDSLLILNALNQYISNTNNDREKEHAEALRETIRGKIHDYYRRDETRF